MAAVPASARGKQVVADDQTENDNEDGEKPICDKEHDRHADTKPEQNKSNKPFHMPSVLSDPMRSCGIPDILLYAPLQESLHGGKNYNK